MREMKDSGIEWIGEIPKDWTVVAVKHCFYINNGSDPITDEGEIPVYGSGSKSFKTCKEFKEGPTVLLGRKGTINIPQWIESRYWNVDTSFDIKAKGNYYLKLFYYCAVCFDYERYTTQTALPSMTQGDYKNFKIPYMNFYEQKDIVKFLDTKCFEIDATAEDIQKEISLLEEYKKSVITEAVTKGLNPDAEMKDSKIFYLGQINKTWNLTKVGYCCKKLYRPFEPSDEALVCSNKGKVVPRGDTLIGLMSSDDNAMQGICKGDIAIHGMDTWHGAIACSDYDGKITRVVHVCKADGDNRFVVYWLQHLAFVGVYKLISNGVRGNTSDFRSWDKVADIYVPNPIKEEQQQIADYLDTKCSEIDTLIADKKRQLDILADYKKSLIYEYVTGKKDVPVNDF